MDDLFSPAPSSAAAGVSGTGRSPDGLGAGPPARIVPTGGASTGAANGNGVGAEADWLEPDDVSPGAALRSAGVTALVATVSLGAGLAFGGPWGAGAGVLLSGALFNGYRAQKWWASPDASEKHEAVVSGVLSVIGLGVGGWMAYKAYTRDKQEESD